VNGLGYDGVTVVGYGKGERLGVCCGEAESFFALGADYSAPIAFVAL
jgi:hypothetical protein